MLNVVDVLKIDIISRKVFGYCNIRDLCRFIKVSPEFKHLVISYTRGLSSLSFIINITSLAPDIISDGRIIAEITSECRILKQFTVSLHSSVLDQHLKNVLTNNHQLKILDISYCPTLTNDSVKFFALNCPLLEELDIEGSNWLTVESMSIIIENLKNLTKFNFGYCKLIDKDCFKSVIDAYPAIKDLGISGTEFVDDSIIKYIAPRCPNLEVLAITKCWKITNNGIFDILEYCPNFCKISIGGCSRLICYDFYQKMQIRNIEVVGGVPNFVNLSPSGLALQV